MAGRPPEPDDEREPTPDADDIDVRFAGMTASLGDLTVPPDERPDDASERHTPEPGAADEPRPDLPLTGFGPRDYALAPSRPGVDDAAATTGDEERYVPPEPPPLSGSDPLLGLAWAGLLLPIALVIVYLVLWRGMPDLLLGLAGAVFLLSVALLVWRMPVRRDADDHDDGAVV